MNELGVLLLVDLVSPTRLRGLENPRLSLLSVEPLGVNQTESNSSLKTGSTFDRTIGTWDSSPSSSVPRLLPSEPGVPRLPCWTPRGLTHRSCLRGSGPLIPACTPLHTLQSQGRASSENKKGPFKPRTLCLWSVWGRHHITCALAALGLGPRSAAKSLGCTRKCIGRGPAPRRIPAERPGPSPCGAPFDPPRDPPCSPRRATSSGSSLRGEQDHTEVRKTEPPVDSVPGPATARIPSRSPLAPSEAASDTSGMSSFHTTSQRCLRQLLRERGGCGTGHARWWGPALCPPGTQAS